MRNKILIGLKFWELTKIGFQGIDLGCYAICDAIDTFFRHPRIKIRKKKKNGLGKNVLKMLSQQSTGRINFVPRIRQRLLMFSCFLDFLFSFCSFSKSSFVDK